MFEFWCEYDINPLIIFSNKGEIIYCNQEAEIFLSYINKKEVFEFAINNAPKKAGIKSEFKRVIFKDFEFTGFSVGYQNEEAIGIRFFINTSFHFSLKELEKINLSTLIQFAIEYTQLKYSTKFSLFIDPSLPPLYTNKKELLELLLTIFENQKDVKVEVKLDIGEYIKIKNQKYPIVEITITPSNILPPIKSNFFEVITTSTQHKIKIPLIKKVENEL